MKKAILIHGYNDKSEYEDSGRPAASNDHWFPWVQRQLLLRGIETQTPEMPGFYKPNYEKWKDMLERFGPDEDTILIGHSCGGGFLVRWLSENNVKVGKVILVAPWMDPEKSIIDPDFFDFEIDEDLCNKANSITMIYSTDDYKDVLESVNIIKNKVKNIKILEFKDKGHFVISSLGTNEFPELLEEALK